MYVFRTLITKKQANYHFKIQLNANILVKQRFRPWFEEQWPNAQSTLTRLYGSRSSRMSYVQQTGEHQHWCFTRQRCTCTGLDNGPGPVSANWILQATLW